MKKIIPIGQRVLVKPMKAEEKTAGGLYIPPSVDEQQPDTGEVVDIGEFEQNINIGDEVFFKKYSPDKLILEGQEYYVIDVDDILAKIK